MQRLAIAALLASALPAWAAEGRPLFGPGIAQLLTGAEVIGEGTRQKFYESGRTLYNDGRDSWGYWRVEGDRYCSQWPPQEGWICYDMRVREQDGRVWVVWIGDSGARYDCYIAR